MFDSAGDNSRWISSSSGNPTFTQNDSNLVKALQEWVKRDNPDDHVNGGGPQPNATVTQPSSSQQMVGATSQPPNKSDTAIKDINVDTYSNIVCQVRERVIISKPGAPDKLAILQVWDGTTPQLDFNQPSLNDAEKESLDSELEQSLAGYVAYVILYGDHVRRAKQLKLGGVYRFHGVHCKMYNHIGKPELYQHERHRALASTVSVDDYFQLQKRLESVLPSTSLGKCWCDSPSALSIAWLQCV